MNLRASSRCLGTLAVVGMMLGAGLWGCGVQGEKPEPETLSTTTSALIEPLESRPATEAEKLADRGIPSHPEANSCLELKEPCEAGHYTCAVRCCDDWLYTFYPIACDGSCTNLANYYCSGHGGPKRIRWQ